VKFDIVIIGGGIIGSAAAYFLGKDGRAGDIAVIEPDPTYTFATTPQGAGGVRQLFSVAENIAMSQFSLRFYENFDAEMACPDHQPAIWFRRQGYLFVVGESGAATLENNHERQTAMGARAELMDVAALGKNFPSLGVGDVALGCYSPDDGWIDPYAALQGFRRNAEHHGVTYIKSRVASLGVNGRAVRTATLDDGRTIEGTFFLNTAGPWCPEIAAMIEAELPIKPMCRAQHYWLCDSDVEPLPLVKDESGMFFRPEGAGFAGGCPTFDIEPGFLRDVDRGFFANYFEETVWPLIANRVPKFESIKLQRTWGGHYAQNMFDGNMIIGTFSPRIDNIITACGFSGHGIMHAPAVGRALCELVLDGGYQTLDLAALGIERVWQDAPYAESGIK
jgi:glycine/D-amino acid oxidase-like deaminating enzyme